MTSINALEIPVDTIQSATAASYTVPADRYAIVRAGVRRGGTLSIDGVVVLYSEELTWSVITSNVSPRTVKNVAGAQQNGFAVASDTYNSPTDQGATFANTTAYAFSSHHETTFKVPTGSVIVGSGNARYHIELYREPGAAS